MSSEGKEEGRENRKWGGQRRCLCLVGEVTALYLLDVRRLSAKLELLGVVALLLRTVRGPARGPPCGDLGEVELVDLGEGETTSLGDEEEDVDGEEGDGSGPKDCKLEEKVLASYAVRKRELKARR